MLNKSIFIVGISHGHTGHVRFLTSVEIDDIEMKIPNSKALEATANQKRILIISGGDGYEDFRNTGNNTISEVAGREDSTNHLLMWQV